MGAVTTARHPFHSQPARENGDCRRHPPLARRTPRVVYVRTYIRACERRGAVPAPGASNIIKWQASATARRWAAVASICASLFRKIQFWFWVLYVWLVRNATTLAPARLRCPIRILWRLLVGLPALCRLVYSCPIGLHILLTCVAPEHIPQAHAEVRSRHWHLRP